MEFGVKQRRPDFGLRQRNCRPPNLRPLSSIEEPEERRESRNQIGLCKDQIDGESRAGSGDQLIKAVAQDLRSLFDFRLVQPDQLRGVDRQEKTVDRALLPVLFERLNQSEPFVSIPCLIPLPVGPHSPLSLLSLITACRVYP